MIKVNKHNFKPITLKKKWQSEYIVHKLTYLCQLIVIVCNKRTSAKELHTISFYSNSNNIKELNKYYKRGIRKKLNRLQYG